MKKLLALVLVLSLLMSYIPFRMISAKKADASDNIITVPQNDMKKELPLKNDSKKEKKSKKINPKKIKGDFIAGDIVIGLNEPHSASEMVKLFPELNIAKRTDLYQSAIKASKKAKKNIDKDIVSKIGTVFYVKLASKTKQSVIDAIEILNKSPYVEYAHPNTVTAPSVIPNDPYYTQTWAMEKIKVSKVWDKHQGMRSIQVGVLDTGIDYTHPDLVNHVNTSKGLFVAGNTNQASMLMDHDGHGTHVAGVIGADGNNFTGVAGVNWNVELIPIRIAINDTLSGSTSTLQAQGIIHASINRIPIINMSYTFTDDPVFMDAVADYDGLFIVAAGNAGMEVGTSPAHIQMFEFENVILVGNSTEADLPAYDSNYGHYVDVFAPGTDIYSTYPVSKGSYAWLSGTSMAAPYVAGAAALIKSYYPYLNNRQIRQVIRYGVDNPTFELIGKSYSMGRINIKKSFELAGDMLNLTDVSGDGMDDITTLGPYLPFSNYVLQVAPTPSQYGYHVWNVSGENLYIHMQDNVKFADVNGDGHSDMVHQVRNGEQIRVSFGQYDTFPNVNHQSPTGMVMEDDTIHLADINGDGRDDLICERGSGSQKGHIFVSLSNGSGYNGWSWSSNWKCVQDNDVVHIEDMDDNGRADLVVEGEDGKLYIGLAQGNGFTLWNYVSGTRMFDPSDYIYFADINGDGLKDMIADCRNNYSLAGYLRVAINPGYGFHSWSWTSSGRFLEQDAVIDFGDINNDGKEELVVKQPKTHANAGYVYILSSSNGQSFSWSQATVSNTALLGELDRFVLTDLTDDNRVDLCFAEIPTRLLESTMYYYPQANNNFNSQSGRRIAGVLFYHYIQI